MIAPESKRGRVTREESTEPQWSRGVIAPESFVQAVEMAEPIALPQWSRGVIAPER